MAVALADRRFPNWTPASAGELTFIDGYIG
jgi:hypothetical protein